MLKLGFQCRDMEIMGCVIRLRLPQYKVNAMMDKYMSARQYRNEYLRCGDLVPKPTHDREEMLKYNKSSQEYELVEAERGKALLYDAHEDIQHFIKKFCSLGDGFKHNPRSYYASRPVAENVEDIRAVVTHGACFDLLQPCTWETNRNAIAGLCFRLYNTLRTLH